jgi:Cu/Zn superoxide dismutase
VVDTAGALRLALSVGGLSPGLHAVRIESGARCQVGAARPDTAQPAAAPVRVEPVDTTSIDTVQSSVDRQPDGGARTLLNQPAPFVGELPDLLASREGLADTSFVLPRSLPATGPGSLLQAEGTSVLIGGGPGVHPDSSARAAPPVACAVLHAAP